MVKLWQDLVRMDDATEELLASKVTMIGRPRWYFERGGDVR